MNKIENIVKEYSSKKLQEIIEQQSFSYSETFIDFAKDEMIRRGENLKFNLELYKEVTAMNDNDLKNLVENEWNDYHLEYLEIARNEYLKRNFKNESTDEEPEKQNETIVDRRYPALITITTILRLFAFLIGIAAVIGVICFFAYHVETWIILSSVIGAAFMILGLHAAAESIKVIIDIEENTRKAVE